MAQQNLLIPIVLWKKMPIITPIFGTTNVALPPRVLDALTVSPEAETSFSTVEAAACMSQRVTALRRARRCT